MHRTNTRSHALAFVALPLIAGFVTVDSTLVAGQAPRPSGIAVFEGARLITAGGGAGIEDSAFVVENSRFARVGRRGQVTVPAGAARVDLAGKTVMPAIIDTHTPDRGIPGDLTWMSGSVSAADLKKMQDAEAARKPGVPEAFAVQARNLAKLNAAGVRIGMGTDGPCAGWNPHIEMADMVAAGMTPAQVIVAATRTSEEILNLSDLGTVAAGKSADFIVLDANPLDDITNTRRIAAVYLRGAAVDRAGLRARWTGRSSQNGQANEGQGGRGNADVPTLPYKLVDWPTPPPSAAGVPGAWNFIQVASVAISPRRSVLVFHRGAHPLMEFDASGKFVRSWGDGMFSEGKVAAIPEAHWTADKSHYSAVYGPAGCTSCGAHSVRVDPQGNIWVVDAPGHVIYKMSADWKEIMRLGTRGSAGTDAGHFNLPTDVAFAPNGDIYVTDGYGNARVVKYSRDGKYLLEWGKRGTGPGEFGLPHNLVVDAQGRVYVTDRDNQRIEVFDSSGKFLTEWSGTGGVSGLAITKDQKIWTGGVLRDLEGKVLGRLPGPGVAGGHGVAVTDSGEVYIAQLSGVVQKFVKQ
jgi:DNA-binding beta-propeller fold protein YncE